MSKEKEVQVEKEDALQVLESGQLEDATALANSYLAQNLVPDFARVPSHAKLCVLQMTPPEFIKTRSVGKTQVPYIEHEYAEKALNMVFNFNVSTEVKHHEFREYKAEKWVDGKKVDKDVVEAECMVEFTFVADNGKEIKRTVYSSHKGWPNPATTRGDIMKSAISKAWTVVARTFGIGADIKSKETKAYQRAAKRAEYAPPAKKDVGF